jgi:integrase
VHDIWHVSGGKLERPVKIKLATSERQRERVLNEEKIEKYLAACATIILDEGFRPGEVFALRRPPVMFPEDGAIPVTEGKSRWKGRCFCKRLDSRS